MTKDVLSIFSNAFSKNVKPTINSSSILINSNNTINIEKSLSSDIANINKDLEVSQTEITPNDYTLVTSLEISNAETKNLKANIEMVSGSNLLETLSLSDEWTSKNEKFDQQSPIGSVSIEDIYTQSPQVIFNDATKELFFQDSSLAKLNQNGCVTPNSDIVPLSKLTDDISLMQLVDKINTFGKVYDFQFKSSDFGNYKNANTSLCSSIANALGYISFDKLLNDEIIRKKHIDIKHSECPELYPAYNGFLVSEDYIKDGWINIDQLAVDDNGIIDENIALSVRTRKIKEAKRIAIKLLLNYSSSIPELNSQNKLVDFGIRVKDTITGQVFDYQNIKNGNTSSIGNQVALSYTGKLEYSNSVSTSSSALVCDPCDKIVQDKCTGNIIKVANCVAGETVEGAVHEIMPQIRLNPLIGTQGVSPDFTNTIDPINWTTGIQNVPNYKVVFKDLIDEWGENEYIVGHLNVPRSFHYASGDTDSAYVCGGFFNSVIKENVSTDIPNNFLNIRAWNLIGDSDIHYEIATPGGYSYSVTNSFVLYYEEAWDGNSWHVKNNTIIPTPKAMGIAGGGKANEEKIIGFGVYDAQFLGNGVIKTLFPTSQVWQTKKGVWTHLNNGNYARVSPAGYLKSETYSTSGESTVAGLDCNVPAVAPKDFFYADSSPSSFPDTTLRLDMATQLKLNSAMKVLTDDTKESVTTKVASNLGIVFNGWIGAGGNVSSNGLGTPGSSNVNPFGLDKIKDSELTNIFEYMQEIKVDFSKVSPSLSPSDPELAASISTAKGWFVDTTRNYPIKTMGTLYIGNECSGVATGGKTGVSTDIQDPVNAPKNIKYSYFNDSRYNEFDNSIINLSYEYIGTGWVRRDNLLEGVAFHTGIGDASHHLIYGGIHGTVERTDISVSYPGCDEWEAMIKSFGGTWHRKGTTGLDREKRYASFNTISEDSLKNTYYKVGDFRDKLKSGITYSDKFIATGSVADLSGVDWSTYVNATSGHMTQVTYANNNSNYPNLLDITYFVGGESWVSKAIKYDKLNNYNPNLPYSERESALDDTDQVGYFTKNILSQEAFKYPESYKPDYNANPLNSKDGISSFPVSGYYASKDNLKNIVNQYKYAGHPTKGGMWLWSRPTAGEELFHPSNIHDKPQYYFDSCNVKHISGTWQTYDKWIDSSFQTNIGLHSSICWYERKGCSTKQEPSVNGYTSETATKRNYRWTVGDFRPKANRLSPTGKQVGCFDLNVASDREAAYRLGYISLCDLINTTNSTLPIAEGLKYSYLYAWDTKNSFRRVFLCVEEKPVKHYIGYVDTGTSYDQIPINGTVIDISSALTISPSANWANFFDYVYETINVTTAPLSGVFFRNGTPQESGIGMPIETNYSSDFFSSNAMYDNYPNLIVNPTSDFVGFDNKCFSPVDYFNRIWFIPTVPISSCCLSGCNFLPNVPFVTGSYLTFLPFANSIISGGCSPSPSGNVVAMINTVDTHSDSFYNNIFSNKQVPIASSVCVTANGLYYGCASTSGCVYLNPCGLYVADCSCLTENSSADPRVFYHTGWFDDRLDAIYGCQKPSGFKTLIYNEACENNSCQTWWTSGCHVITHEISGKGFYWVHGAMAPYLYRDNGFYPNNFSISGCGPCSYGLQNPTSFWNFKVPQTNSITKVNNLRELFDILSFGLPEDYVKPSKFVYSFYITRDGVGLDQFFYGKKKSQFVERWKFPHVDTILETLAFNSENPNIIKNDGTGTYVPLSSSGLFKYGSLSVGDFLYPQINIDVQDNVDATDLVNSIILMSSVQADISSSRVANYFTPTTNTVTASCNFESLRNWMNIKADDTVREKFTSHYYPMSYDNFSGPVTGGSYFLPRGVLHQSQFSIIPSANSSAIRDRAGLWPWCDLLEGKSTNKPKLGGATWYWDTYGNIWTAETIGIEKVTPSFCIDQLLNTDPLHRNISTTTISEIYPDSYDREIYRIKCQDKKGNILVDYKITYDEVAGPEIIGSKEGFDYNIFGTSLLPRQIDLINYNNKPLNGPTQSWVDILDEPNSIHAINWRRTQLNGTSGCPVDLYPYNYGTVCEMLSGGYYKNNIRNGNGYFCRIGSDKDTWIYSAPIGDANITINNSNFFIQESPFAIKSLLKGSAIGMTTVTNSLTGSGFCVIDGFPPLTAVCHSVSSAPGMCCYYPGSNGTCLSFDIITAKYVYDANVCGIYVSKTISISSVGLSGAITVTPCVSSGILSVNSVPLSSIGFFSFGEVPPSGYSAPYTALGWVNCNQIYGSYGSEIVRSVRYENDTTNGAIVSSAYITGPQSFGLGGLGLGKSTSMCGKLLYSGNRISCQYSQFNNNPDQMVAVDSTIRKAWPWNVLAFDGLLGPTGYTDALDDEGNYWIAIGDINNTNPYIDTNFVSFEQNKFKNHYTIIKVDKSNKKDFFNTVLARTNWKEVDGSNLNSVLCLSESFNLINEDVRGTRLREGIQEALNMQEGQRYYSLYVKLVQENSTNIYEDSVVTSKANYSTSGSYILPVEPLEDIPNVEVIQKLDLISQFDINCTSCYICDSSFLTDSPSASNWKQHNHEEWIAPYFESPFAGPYSEQGFNIWLTAGSEPRWGVSLWSSNTEGKVWANYRRQRLHVDTYRNHLVLSALTAAVAIDDFEALSTSSYNLSGATSHVPVYINYDEFIYCLDDYRNAKVVSDLIKKETSLSKNGVDCTDHIIASVNNSLLLSVSGSENYTNYINGAVCATPTQPCSGFDISLLKNANEAYVEWVSNFVQEYRNIESVKCGNDKKYYFKYNLNTNMDSNTYMDKLGINKNDIIPYQWNRYQDGVGLGGDAPSLNLFDNNTEFTCNRINQWFIGQTAFGTTDKALIVGGYAIAGDGELHRSHSWWESPTFGVSFKWNKNVIQPEDTANINYKYRTLSPFWSTGENSGATSTMGVTIFDVSGKTKVERQGTAKFETNTLTYEVVFDNAIPDYLPNKDKYCISLVCSDNVKVWWDKKTAKGFTINTEATFSGFVDWSVYLEDNVPGDNIDGIDEQDNFEKFDEL